MNNTEEKKDVVEREFSFRGVLFGCIVGLVLMVLMTYLLAVLGMDMHISPVATVLGIVLIPLFGGKTSKKEVNIMQTVASAVGCSCLALPTTYVAALIMGEEFRVMELLIPLLIANVIGICFVTLFKNHYVNDESLPFPQSQMCKSALDQVGVLGKKDARILFIALAVGVVISFLQNMGMVPMMFDFSSFLPSGISMGLLVMPMMLGMGYILGMKVSLVLLIASLVSNAVLGPIGTSAGWFVDPQVDYTGLQYFNLPMIIGASIVASLVPMIKQWKVFVNAFKLDKNKSGSQEDSKLVKTMSVVLGIASLALIAVCCVFYHLNVLHMILLVIISLVFSLVAVRVQAESGMSAGFALNILQIFIVYLLTKNAAVALIMSCIIFTVTGLAMDTMADLKTGQYVGASHTKQIWGQFIGVAVGSIGGVIFFYYLIKTYGLQHPLYSFPIGQMNFGIVSGFSGEGASVFHLGRFAIGGVAGLILALLHLPAGAIAIAFYLAPSTVMGIVLGGVIRFIVEKIKGAEFAVRMNNAATGVVVGDALVGIILLFLMMAM